MTLKARGQDVTLQLTLDGAPQKGSWLKVKNYQRTDRSEIKTQGYLGETEDDLDQQHNGYDVSFEVDNVDGLTLEYAQAFASRERDGLRPQRVGLLVIYSYREVAAIRGESLEELFLKVDDHGASGRDANVTTKFSGKCKRFSLLKA